MAIATGTALALGALGGAGASIFGAVKQSSAAKDAAAQQQQAAQAAIAAQTPLYTQALQIAQQQAAQGQAGLAPYAQQGAAGLTALSKFLGVPAGAPAASAPMAAPASPMAAAPAGARPPSAFAGPPIGTAVPRGLSTALGAPTGGATVLLRAPTGQTQAVPADQVAYYVARGATQV